MPGSAPERRISFFPMQSRMMAMAVSEDDVAALRMNSVDRSRTREIPYAPIWLSIPPSVVRSGQSLPAGTQMFARSLERAQAVTLALAPEVANFAARAGCALRDRWRCGASGGDLTNTTKLLLRVDRTRTPERPTRPT